MKNLSMHFRKLHQKHLFYLWKLVKKIKRNLLTKCQGCAIIYESSRVNVSYEPAVLAQLDRVPGYEPVGRGFESLTPCQNKKSMACPWAFCFASMFGVRLPFKLPATFSLALSRGNLMPTPREERARFGGVQNPLHRAKTKSPWLLSAFLAEKLVVRKLRQRDCFLCRFVL